MTQTIVLFWQEESEQYPWQLVTEQGRFIQKKSGLDVITQTVGQEEGVYRLIVIIPSVHCFFSEVKVPGNAGQKMLQALPYLMEEKIAEEPESVFTARIAKINDEKWATAVIRRAWLSNLIETLRAHRLEADCVIPDVLILPYHENKITLAVNKEYCWMRYGLAEGVQCERENLFLLLESTVKKEIVLFCEEDEEEVIRTELQSRGFTIVSSKLIENWPVFFSEQSRACPYNLLQNEFTPKRKNTKEKKLLMIAGAVFAAFLGVTLVGEIAQYFYFKYQYRVTQTEIGEKYRTVFPGTTRVVNPRTTLQKELQKWTEVRKQGSFLFLLAEFGKVVSNVPTVTVESMDYKPTTLTVTLKGENFTVLKEIGQQLEQAGFSVKQEGAVSQEQGVTGRFVLQR